MLEQSMVLSRTEARSRLVFLPLAAALHAAIFTAAMIAAVWNVQLPSTPPHMRELWVPSLQVATPPPPPPPPAAATRRTEPVPEQLAPVTTPAETRIEPVPVRATGAENGSTTATGTGTEGGEEGGVDDGVIGSITTGPIVETPKISVPVRPGAGVSTPVNLVRIEPTYPELAKKIGVQGLVVIECVIARDGSVRDPKVVRGAHPLLDKAALEAVRQWKFAPGRMGDRPVDVLFNLTVTFEMK
ncbi:MAG: energy transducer TonB [Acidobacteria bacterium]|nr:energy transducer TonB [Acidobacteriota bacterium]